MSDEATIPELERRLLSALLQPVVSMCRRFRLPLSDLEGLCRLAYYEALRDGGESTQAEVAEVFGTSLRTVVGVEKKLRTRFDADEAEVTLWRRVEESLTSGTQTAHTIASQLNAEASAVQRALSGLVAAGRAETATPGDDGMQTFAATVRFRSLVRADLVARIDGLKHQLEVVERAVSSRFLGVDERPAVARTLAFMGTPDEVEAMGAALVKTMRLHAIEVEEKALAGDGYQRYGVTMALAPSDDKP